MFNFLIKLFRDRKIELSILYQELYDSLPDFYYEELPCVPEEILIQLEQEKQLDLPFEGDSDEQHN